MATIYVDSGATGGTNAGTSWANAYLSIASALPASSGDNILIASTHSETFSATTTLSPAAGVTLASANNSTSAYTTGATIISTATTFTVNGGGSWFGVTFTAGSADSSIHHILVCSATGTQGEFDQCTFFLNNTAASSSIGVGTIGSVTSSRAALLTKRCTFKFGATGQGFGNVQTVCCKWFDQGSNIDGGSIHPTILFKTMAVGANLYFNGSDFSANANTLFPDATAAYRVELTNCLINSAATIQATQSVDGGGEVFLYDCGTISSTSSDQTIQYALGHFSYRGNTVMSASVYVTSDGASYDGTSRHSMVITGVNATFANPYYGPWIDVYTAGGSSITPYLEALRTSSATKYNNDQAWAEFMAKTTAGSVRSTLYSCRKTVLASAAALATGAGTGSWTGAGATPSSMKLDSGSAFTPQSIGFLRARVAMAANDTIYVDCKIRGA